MSSIADSKGYLLDSNQRPFYASTQNATGPIQQGSDSKFMSKQSIWRQRNCIAVCSARRDCIASTVRSSGRPWPHTCESTQEKSRTSVAFAEKCFQSLEIETTTRKDTWSISKYLNICEEGLNAYVWWVSHALHSVLIILSSLYEYHCDIHFPHPTLMHDANIFKTYEGPAAFFLNWVYELLTSNTHNTLC